MRNGRRRTIAAMILVNSPGNSSHYSPLAHASVPALRVPVVIIWVDEEPSRWDVSSSLSEVAFKPLQKRLPIFTVDDSSPG